MSQTLTTRQTQRMAPQQYLVATMTAATSDELERLINDELEKNIVLEVDDGRESDIPSEDTSADIATSDDDEQQDRTDSSEADRTDDADDIFFDYDDTMPSDINRSPDDVDYSPINNYRSDITFRDELKAQIALMDIDDERRYLADYIVDSLEDDGYLTRTLRDLVDDLEFNQRHETSERMLADVLVNIVQTLEPAGIGARDIRECLLLQLQEHRGTPAAALAWRIVNEAFDDFTHRRYEKLCSRFGASTDEIDAAQRVILSLNPKPGGLNADVDLMRARAGQVVPDFTVHNEDGELVLTLNDEHVPDVRISTDYETMLQQLQKERTRNEDHRQGYAMVRDRIASARAFIDALRQRRQTLTAVMKVIVAMQRDFFLSGDREQLRPMILREVAEHSGYDISTVSRVSRSKYVETDFGVLPVKDLFTTAIATDGEDVSNVKIMDALRRLIDGEDKHSPLTDEALSSALREMGYPTARRTVAKYRERLGYNKATLRREA